MKTILKIVFFIIVIFYINLIYQVFVNNQSQNKIPLPTPIPSLTPTLTPTTLPTPSPNPVSPANPLNSKRLFVNPDGNDNNDGRSSPLKTIQKAIDIAEPGDVIELMPGIYLQDVVTKRDGLPNLPITITGPKSAIIQGAKNARVFVINHSYTTLSGFAIDGHYQSSKEKSSYRDKLIYVIGKYPKRGVTNVKIVNMEISNAGGECIRFRYFSQFNEVAYNFISRCGITDFEFNSDGKNGEGIYIGTAPEQRDDGRSPTKDVDQSNNNWIHHNTINTQGNECVDIKEGSSLNVVEYNNCTGQRDPESAGLDSRGDNNIFRYNYIYNNIGAGVRLGGDQKNDGINNQVYENTIVNNKAGGIKIQRMPQGEICGNKMEGNEKDSSGSYGSKFQPQAPCN